jgi:mannose-6-phosphate isomerase-like protein (cupin superfamily)
LEHKNDTVVSRLVIYPSSALSLEFDGHQCLHLVAVNGVIKIHAAGRTSRLKAGEAAVFSQKDVVRLENTQQQPASLIQVQVG